VVGGGFGPLDTEVRREGLGHVVVEQRRTGREAVGGEVRSVGPQFGRRLVAGGGRPRDDGEFEDVGFQRVVEGGVAAAPELGLVASEGTDHVDGGVGSVGTRQQIEPPRDEDVGDEDVQVAGVAVAGGPGVLVGESAGQREPLVDELDAGGTVAVAVVGRGITADPCGGECQHAGSECGVVEPRSDAVAELFGLDIVDTCQCGTADHRHFLHWFVVAVAGAKTFGNTVVSGSMVRVTGDGDVCVLTFDRPARRNALDRVALRELLGALEDATEPVVYLHGEGEAFCAGADLAVVDALDADGAADFAGLGQRVANALEAYDGAVVAGIDGAARGGGVELALACDLRVATPDATLAETGVTLGLFGAWGGTTRLPRLVGESAAMDLALSGRTVDAETALCMGLVSRVTTEPRAVADELAGVDHAALRTLKRRLREDTDQPTGDERERSAFGALVDAAEF